MLPLLLALFVLSVFARLGFVVYKTTHILAGQEPPYDPAPEIREDYERAGLSERTRPEPVSAREPIALEPSLSRS
jgi:hypothetical protein